MDSIFSSARIQSDYAGLLRCIRRQALVGRIHFIELFIDPEIQQAVCDRFGLAEGLHRSDPCYELRKQVSLQRFLGYDYVRCSVDDLVMPLRRRS